jgi:hypothetical protein
MHCQFSPDVFALWRVGQSLENVTFLRDKTGQVIVFSQGFRAYPRFVP